MLNKMTRYFIFTALIAALPSSQSAAKEAVKSYPVVGELKQYDPEFSKVIKPGTSIEKISDDAFQWAEGPVWVPGDKKQPGYLLADDVPKNIMYRWSEQDGLTVFLQPSGLANPDPAIFREPGANGLFLESAHSILAADSGNRQITRIDLTTKKKNRRHYHISGQEIQQPQRCY